MNLRIVALVGALLPAAAGLAAESGGTYVGEADASIRLELRQSSDGAITGTLADAVVVLPVEAREAQGVIEGTVAMADQPMPFTATLEGERLLMRIGPREASEEMVFRRADAATAVTPPGSGDRKVFFNGEQLADAELAQIEQAYQLRIPDADYWYDPLLGAWGVRGSPALGFILPGLSLGGPLQADASGGGTGVHVNGRELHPYDLMALQQLVGAPILPGRYFITHEGVAGLEGGPPLWNLVALGSRGADDNPTGTWRSDITGASGFSDGTTGAVFLPDGGIVSTGE